MDSIQQIKVSQILKIPLLVTEQAPAKLGYTAKELDLSTAVCITDKTQFSMWPSIQSKIAELGVESVVLFGLESHVCIAQTALDCLEQKLHTVILADGVSSINKWELLTAIEVILLAIEMWSILTHICKYSTETPG